MIKLLHELLTNTLTSPFHLPINPLYEFIAFLLIGAVAFRIAWNAVGRLHVRGQAGSDLHWIIRIIAYIVLWAIICGLIQSYYYFSVNWELGFTLVGGVVGAIVLPTIAISTMRTIKKLKVNHHA